MVEISKIVEQNPWWRFGMEFVHYDEKRVGFCLPARKWGIFTSCVGIITAVGTLFDSSSRDE